MIDHIKAETGYLDTIEIDLFMRRVLTSLDGFHGQRVLVLVPDQTRTMPLKLVFDVVCQVLAPHTHELDFMIALGTHPPLNEDALNEHLGHSIRNGCVGSHHIYQHVWDDPAALKKLGRISPESIYALSKGKLNIGVDVCINKHIFAYDAVLICGPVFPHEVVGFSGGNKYFFPGIAGPDMINVTHWLGAVLSSNAVIGAGYTPVRAVLDRAAAMIPLQKHALCFVLDKGGVFGIFSGSPENAWESASVLSGEKHIIRTGRRYPKVIAVMPEMYQDLWVGGKGMYKLEPVVEDGGELIIYAPHIKEISTTHGQFLRQIGYHVCGYFQANWEDFKQFPWSVLAHSTHVSGLGTYDVETGQEHPRIRVTLATGISETVCQSINLHYRDPASLDPEQLAAERSKEVLVVEDAGEVLYRVK